MIRPAAFTPELELAHAVTTGFDVNAVVNVIVVGEPPGLFAATCA